MCLHLYFSFAVSDCTQQIVFCILNMTQTNPIEADSDQKLKVKNLNSFIIKYKIITSFYS